MTATVIDLTAAKAEKDIGLIKRITDEIRRCDRFAQDAGNALYVYRNGVYQPRGDQYVKREVKRILESWGESKLWSSRRASEVVEYLRVDAPPLWEQPPLDRVNLVNGVLDIAGSILMPHSPEFLSPIQLPIAYDPNAKCAAWEDFIAATFPDDARDTGFQILSWLMLPDMSLQKAILLLGDGSNGKSRYLKAVESFIGKRNMTANSLHRLESDKFAVARLVGKLANICPDLPSEHLKGTSVFKALVGGDTLQAEYKFKDSFEFAPFCRLLFSANNLPRSGDSSGGFFRRWLVIPFDRTFDPDSTGYIPSQELDARLADPKELSGALNRALDYLPLSQISETESMRQAMDEFRQMTDPLAVWLDMHTLLGADFFITKAALLDAYNGDAHNSDRPSMTGMAFSLALRKLRPGLRDSQRTIGGKVCWIWTGIGLKAR